MDDEFKVLDLFSGIGGFSLGLERTGRFRTVAFCERDGYACRVLRKHWPTVPIFEDIRTLSKQRLKAHGIGADVLCGGFPCQDISTAGKGEGIDGERSGLWGEYARLIREVRPRYAIVENVAALRSRGLDRVLGDLAAIGYDAEWHCIPASHLGAPHRRDRLWIIAFPHADRHAERQSDGETPQPGQPASRRDHAQRLRADVADAACLRPRPFPVGQQAIVRADQFQPDARFGRRARRGGSRWETEPDLPRVADGVPHRVDRLRCLGNAVVPQIPELIGRAIVAHHDAARAIAT